MSKLFFFFQAEDGIRDSSVTGVQTCALPICGTPTASGTCVITFTAQNGVTPNGLQNFTLTVNQAPAITSANAASFQVGAAGTFSVITCGCPPPSITAIGPLPAGVPFLNNGNGTGTLSG